MERLKCVIVDDDAASVTLLTELCREISYLEVVSTFQQPAKFIHALPGLEFDLCIVALNMKQMNGLSVAEPILEIQGYKLRKWLEHLSSSGGVYFLDNYQGKYSIHFKHHGTGQLMELEQELVDDKEYLESLLFDLSLFPDTPILAFDAGKVANDLYTKAAIYFEYAKEIDMIVGRLVEIDMKSLFEQGIYKDSRIEELTIDDAYQAFFPGTCRSFKEQGTYGMYLIFEAIVSIFSQITVL